MHLQHRPLFGVWRQITATTMALTPATREHGNPELAWKRHTQRLIATPVCVFAPRLRGSECRLKGKGLSIDECPYSLWEGLY